MAKVRTLLSVLVLYLAYYYYKSSNTKKPQSPFIVETLSGSVRGVISKSRQGQEIYEFLGIPYAKPPQGELRFELPQPVEKWEGVRETNAYGSICLQVDPQIIAIQGEEDCLFLNVFVPKREDAKLLPVMVFIHGGMFVYGSGDLYQPEYFMDHPVILVTLNYRLGSLGFLNAGIKSARGNMGLQDQNTALRWVQANIASFGGDPKKVTIFGESAGAASVHHQILSPLSKGLFQKAISQSATALAYWSTRFNPIEQAKHLGKKLGCPVDDSNAMVKCLKDLDGVKLMEASFADILDVLRDSITIFNPSIELIKDDKAFLVEAPADIIRKGEYNKVDWITGVTSFEGLLISSPMHRDGRFSEVKKDLPKRLMNLIWHEGPINPESVQKIKEFYFGKDEVDAVEKFDNWTSLLSDTYFAAPAQKAISLQSEHSNVYGYFYSYQGQFQLAEFIFSMKGKYPAILEYREERIFLYSKRNSAFTTKLFLDTSVRLQGRRDNKDYFLPKWFKKTFLGIEPVHYGACHFDEIALQFPLKGLYSIKATDKDYEFSKSMVKSWVDFSSDAVGKPPQFAGKSWPLAKEGGSAKKPLQYMQMDITSGVIDEPNAERNKFWNTLKL